MAEEAVLIGTTPSINRVPHTRKLICGENPALHADTYINLSDVEGIPHPELFDMVTKVILEDTLRYVNMHSDAVVPRTSFYTRYGKRSIDIVLASLALIITLPVNLLLAVCTLFDVGRPIIFRQSRVGLNGNVFKIMKFRNMTNETDENGQLLPPSQRVTKFGRFVRKTSLDELLNFWSVLKGDMSLIGPRPLLLDYINVYSDRHRMRHAVRPGLECPIILESTDRSTWAGQFENDVYYVEHVSLLLDIKMAFALARMVFDRNGTAARGNAMKGSFMGYNRDGSSIDSHNVPIRYFDEALERMGYNKQRQQVAMNA